MFPTLSVLPLSFNSSCPFLLPSPAVAASSPPPADLSFNPWGAQLKSGPGLLLLLLLLLLYRHYLREAPLRFSLRSLAVPLDPRFRGNDNCSPISAKTSPPPFSSSSIFEPRVHDRRRKKRNLVTCPGSLPPRGESIETIRETPARGGEGIIVFKKGEKGCES